MLLTLTLTRTLALTLTLTRCDEGRVLVQEYVGALGAATGLKELKVAPQP
jgi:hypothetical protein